MDDEVVACLNQVFDDWLASEWATPVEPIGSYVKFAVSFLGGAAANYRYDKRNEESVFVVNLDGGVWGVGTGERYEPEYRYGNIFTDSFEHMLASPGRMNVVAAAEGRVASYCADCPYFGHCPGSFVADATAEEMAALNRSGCPERKILDHIVDTLRRSDILNELQIDAQPVDDNVALSVAF